MLTKRQQCIYSGSISLARGAVLGRQPIRSLHLRHTPTTTLTAEILQTQNRLILRFQSENMTITVIFEHLSARLVAYNRYFPLSDVLITGHFNMAGIQNDSGPGKFVLIAEIFL